MCGAGEACWLLVVVHAWTGSQGCGDGRGEWMRDVGVFVGCEAGVDVFVVVAVVATVRGCLLWLLRWWCVGPVPGISDGNVGLSVRLMRWAAARLLKGNDTRNVVVTIAKTMTISSRGCGWRRNTMSFVHFDSLSNHAILAPSRKWRR